MYDMFKKGDLVKFVNEHNVASVVPDGAVGIIIGLPEKNVFGDAHEVYWQDLDFKTSARESYLEKISEEK